MFHLIFIMKMETKLTLWALVAGGIWYTVLENSYHTEHTVLRLSHIKFNKPIKPDGTHLKARYYMLMRQI